MKAAKIALTQEVVIELLGLPSDTVIIGADMVVRSGVLILGVHHPALDDLPEGYELPNVTVTDLRKKVEDCS